MTVKKEHYQQGTVPKAADLNQPYDDLATESASVDSDNTASGWATISHFDLSAQQCNRLYDFSYDGVGVDTIGVATYTTVNVTSAAEIDLTGFFPDQYEATRFCASGLVRGTTIATDLDAANYYAFRLLLTYSDGGGSDVTTTIGEWGYSLTARSLVTDLASGTAESIKYQTFQFSAVRRYDGATGNRQYKKLELQCKVNDATNSVDVSRHQIFVVSGRR